MFERFTDRARRVVVLAEEEATRLHHGEIGTEHLLLGLIDEREGVAATALESLGISLEAVRSQVEEIIGQGGSSPSGHLPFTPRAKKVLELSLREALQLGHNYIGTEHILLGLIREGEGVAAQVLVNAGADLSRVRRQVGQLLADVARRHRPSIGLRPATGPTDRDAAADPGSGPALTMVVQRVVPLVAALPLSRDPKIRLALTLTQHLARAQGGQPADAAQRDRSPANVVANPAEAAQRLGRLLASYRPVTQAAAVLGAAGLRAVKRGR